jgi:hypothetical protein
MNRQFSSPLLGVLHRHVEIAYDQMVLARAGDNIMQHAAGGLLGGVPPVDDMYDTVT